MAGNVSGPSGVPPRGDTAQRITDTLARLENGQAMLAAAVSELATQFADLSRRITDAEDEAEEILRRATAPGPARHATPRRLRRDGGAALWLVRAVAVTLLGLGVILAAMTPVRIHQQRNSPQCLVQCSRPVAHHTGRTPHR